MSRRTPLPTQKRHSSCRGSEENAADRLVVRLPPLGLLGSCLHVPEAALKRAVVEDRGRASAEGPAHPTSIATLHDESSTRGHRAQVDHSRILTGSRTAHEARIDWPIGKEDAEDLLSLVSLIHRRLDAAHMRSHI
jgi:hypothetical protein